MRLVGDYSDKNGETFQSTHPVRGATGKEFEPITYKDFISIHAPRAGCDIWLLGILERRWISIHAPRAGCDHTSLIGRHSLCNFNPRTPCGVRRQPSIGSVSWADYFNPRTPCGVRLLSQTPLVYGVLISIHAPRAGCDWRTSSPQPKRLYFNPRTPCGVRHIGPASRMGFVDISIHAPRAGCDGSRTR